MKFKFRILLTILILIPGQITLFGQKPISQLPWKFVATGMPDAWYGSAESKQVAANVLLYQRDAGGWPKNTPIHKPLNDAEKAKVNDDKGLNDAIFDNDATTTEMKFLAKMFNKTNEQDYKISFNTGLKFILDAQYDNGGWPMFFPLRKGYYTHITFNDNAMVNILNMLRAIAANDEMYRTITNPEYVSKAKVAWNKGIECILATQIKVNGKLTVWCAQHDENTLLPAKARSYELPSFSGAESVGIVRLLMSVENPDPRIINSVLGAVNWFELNKLNNVKWEYFTNSDGLKDRRIINDKNAGALWARFYDLETNLPFVCDRDGIKKNRLEEIGYERRNGYSWYTDSPQEVLDAFPAWKSKWVK